MNTSRTYSELYRSLLLLAFLVFASGIIEGCAPGIKTTSSPSVTPSAVAQRCSATVREFPLPASTLTPTHITTGPDGKLWVIETPMTATQGNPQDSFLGRLTPPSFQQFAVPFSLADLNALTGGPDGNLWYMRYGKVGRLTPTGQVHEFPLPELDSNVGGITAGPDGNLWFTESRADAVHPVAKIGRITPGGQVREFVVPTPNSDPGGITVGPDGTLWFTDIHTLGRITLTGTISECASLPTQGAILTDITDGGDRHLWFTALGQSGGYVGQAV